MTEVLTVVPEADRTIHDYTKYHWGHALHEPRIFKERVPRTFWEIVTFRPVQYLVYLTCLGHGLRVNHGDILKVNMMSGDVGLFLVDDIYYYDNPRDMFDLKKAYFIGYDGDDPCPDLKLIEPGNDC